jgi:hypothetical protein
MDSSGSILRSGTPHERGNGIVGRAAVRGSEDQCASAKHLRATRLCAMLVTVQRGVWRGIGGRPAVGIALQLDAYAHPRVLQPRAAAGMCFVGIRSFRG